MPTKRDDAAYKRHYGAMRTILADFDASVVRRRIEITLHVWDHDQIEHEAAKMDAATDIPDIPW
ncbi:hypothetical protein ACHMW5_13885 [Azospirillum melinis]|uniref:hypothetical protein n=1 Tax=Azospirillum melinis TaxID=328839 RepID=UPI0037576015